MTLNRRISMMRIASSSPVAKTRRKANHSIEAMHHEIQTIAGRDAGPSVPFLLFERQLRRSDQGRWGQRPSRRLALRRVRPDHPKSKAHG